VDLIFDFGKIQFLDRPLEQEISVTFVAIENQKSIYAYCKV
jgi:hypothetical protein